MSIAFLPITNSDSSIYNESSIKEKWNQFIVSFSKSLSDISDNEIDVSLLDKIVERSILKHYGVENKDENKKIKVVNKIEETSSSEEEELKKEVVKKERKIVKKSKEVKERCKQILTNNEQCKSNQVKDSEYCSRHAAKHKKISKNEDEDSD